MKSAEEKRAFEAMMAEIDSDGDSSSDDDYKGNRSKNAVKRTLSKNTGYAEAAPKNYDTSSTSSLFTNDHSFRDPSKDFQPS